MSKLNISIAMLAFCPFIMHCAAAGLPTAVAFSSAAQESLTTRAGRDDTPSEPRQLTHKTKTQIRDHPASNPAAHQPGKQQQDHDSRYHGTLQLLGLSNVVFLPLANTSASKSSSTTTDSNNSHRQQHELSQTACLRIKAVLSIAGQQQRQVLTTPAATSNRYNTKSSHHSQQQVSTRSVPAGNTSHSTAVSAGKQTKSRLQTVAVHVQPPTPLPHAAMGTTSMEDLPSITTYKVCRQQSSARADLHTRSGVAAAAPEHRVALLVPLQRYAAAAAGFDVSKSHASTDKQADAGNTQLLLTLYAEQHVAGQAYLWTGSQMLAEDSGVVNIELDMRQYAYSWTIAQPPTAPTVQIETGSPACTSSIGSSLRQQPSATQQSQDMFEPSSAAADAMTSSQQAPVQQQLAPAQTAACSTCPSLQQVLQTHAAWIPSGAAYSVAEFFDAHSNHAQWAGHVLAGARASSTNDFGLKKLSNEDSSGSKQMCPVWLPKHGSQDRCMLADATAQNNTTNNELSTTVRMLNWHPSNNIIIQLSQQQLVIISAATAAAVLLITYHISKTSTTPATVMPVVVTAAAAKPAASKPALQHASHEAALCTQQFELPDTVAYWESRDQTDDPTGNAPDDPFGYGSSTAALGSYSTASQQPPAAALAVATAAVRRTSALAAGLAAGTLKAAFANRAVMPTRGAAAEAGTGNSGGYPAIGASTAAKANVAYWDNADEEAVNQLPASIQAHLQAAGRWTRDKGGRLVRGSMRALRAASTMAAGALAQAAGSAGAAGAGAVQALAGHSRGGDAVADGGGGETSSGDAALLRRLMVAGPGAELVLSDDEA